MINYPCPHDVTFYCLVCELKKENMDEKEPELPNKVKHIQGLYTKEKSDLFIDDLTGEELDKIADHRKWYLNKKYD